MKDYEQKLIRARLAEFNPNTPMSVAKVAMMLNATAPIMVAPGSWEFLDFRTQEQIDFAEAMAEVNAIAPGWPV